MDEFNTEYIFKENEDGIYVSDQKFAIQQDIAYKLKIVTKNNSSYESRQNFLPKSEAQIMELSYIKTSNSEGKEGFEILVDSFDPTGNSRYYKYEFEETQRIVVPDWGPQEIIIVSDISPFEVTTIPNDRSKRTCYKTTTSNGNIIQIQTNEFSEDRVTKFPVKFISITDSVIRDRYSILVKQHVQSIEAYSYFNTLNDLGSSESVLSANQPGFLEGNIVSITNINERVIGFFELTSVSTERLFLNYEDVFPNANRLPFFVACGRPVWSTPALVDPNNRNFSPLIDLVKKDKVRFWFRNEDFFGNFIEDPPFTVTPTECGDCTFWGSNVKPDFWID